MGVFDFVKDAGEKIFGRDDDPKKDEGATAVLRTPDKAMADRRKGEALTALVGGMSPPGLHGVATRFRIRRSRCERADARYEHRSLGGRHRDR